MEKQTSQPSKKGIYAAIAGTKLVALCCFTPILVFIFGIVGLSVLTPYLDYVLLPALAVMIVLTILSFRKWKKALTNSETYRIVDWCFGMKNENFSSLGTIITAFLATSCCLAPAVFVIFGASIGFLGKLTFLAPISPYLLGAAFLMLIYSFWKLYIKKIGCTCKEDFRAQKLGRLIFCIGFVAVIFASSFQTIIARIYS